jgi:hypothetical protein
MAMVRSTRLFGGRRFLLAVYLMRISSMSGDEVTMRGT